MNCGKSAKISGFLYLFSDTGDEKKILGASGHEKVIDMMNKYTFWKIFKSFPCILRPAGL